MRTYLLYRSIHLAELSNRERQSLRTLALALSLQRREQRYQATLISDDELDDEIDDTDLCFGVFFGILLSLLFDLTQRIIENGV